MKPANPVIAKEIAIRLKLFFVCLAGVTGCTKMYNLLKMLEE